MLKNIGWDKKKDFIFPQGIFFRGLESIEFLLFHGPLRSLLSSGHRGRMVLPRKIFLKWKNTCVQATRT